MPVGRGKPISKQRGINPYLENPPWDGRCIGINSVWMSRSHFVGLDTETVIFHTSRSVLWEDNQHLTDHTKFSQWKDAVTTHPNSNRAQRCLISVIGRGGDCTSRQTVDNQSILNLSIKQRLIHNTSGLTKKLILWLTGFQIINYTSNTIRYTNRWWPMRERTLTNCRTPNSPSTNSPCTRTPNSCPPSGPSSNL